jgi:hypothetical protein
MMQNIFTWANDHYDKIAVEDAIMCDVLGRKAFCDCQWCTAQAIPFTDSSYCLGRAHALPALATRMGKAAK